MDKEKILKWMSRTETCCIRDYENKNGVQSLALVLPSKPDELYYRTFRPDYPDFSHCLKKNPWWKRLLFQGKYAGKYLKTTTTGPHRLVVKEAVDDKVFWQADVEKNPVLAQIISENEKRLAAFRQKLKPYFTNMASNTEKDMFPFQQMLYNELCLRHPEKKTGLEYIRILLCRCSREQNRHPGPLLKVKNPLEYMDEALCKGFPYESIVCGFIENVYANLCKSFYGDVEMLSDIFDSSESLVLYMDGYIDDCRIYLRFPKMLDLLTEYLEC